MKHRQLPQDLQDRVWHFFQYKWLATRGVDEESVLRALPLDLRRAIQRHQCLSLVCRVPFFSEMDDQLLDAICERLFSSLGTKGTYIIREGDPVNAMMFIIRGRLESSTTDGGRSGFFNSITLVPGDFCGEELLTWALMPNSYANLPPSTRTVRALEEIEAFALRAEDLKFVANQFKRLHSKKLQHTFRYYSQQWRTWGARYIQAAWRRFKKRKLAKGLAEHESLFHISHGSVSRRAAEMPVEHGNGKYVSDDDSVAESLNNVLHMGSTSVTSEFAKNAMRGEYQKIEQPEPSTVSIQMLKLMRPDEPDFSINSDGPDGTI